MTEPERRSIVVEREMPHPPAKIWRALTEPALIAEWLMQNDFRAVVGHRFHFRAPPAPGWNGVTQCEVMIVEPMKRLSYSWNATEPGGLSTVVNWTLTPTRDGTHVRMEQSGFRPEDEANYRGAGYGWQRFLPALERVASGIA
jgi:uncharacterized protein YndB with AHSA1/START domain